MKNELLKIGPFTVYGYGLMIAVGILAAYFTGERRAKKRGLPYEHVFNLVVWCVLGGFLGAKILYWITEWKEHCGQSGLSQGYPDGWVRCVWRHYRGNPYGVCVLQDKKSGFSSVL